MNMMVPNKITASHLKRNAYLYIRQSTLRQVFENTESTKRQYALKDKAVALGWPIERIEVIDSDLGQSGASAVNRTGFQQLVADVGMGRAGIVLGLEVSRLARSSTDWHRLLEICALTDTLILDEDGIYDPSHFNDRLLLGLKGTMSEAELHVLRARLRGGILNKARRGELKVQLPIGFVYCPDDKVILDPDQQIRQALSLLFQVFRQSNSAWATVKAFREQGLLFPQRLRSGPSKGEVIWGPLLHYRVLRTLRNPLYAGAFCYGRTRVRKTADGRSIVSRLPQDEWHALIPNAHEGYISWTEYEKNLCHLRENAQAYGQERRKSPPREGPALLQGLVVCGICGYRMTVRYHSRGDRLIPEYVCQKKRVEYGAPLCQHILGADLDEAIGKLLVEAVTPITMEVSIAVQHELNSRTDEADRLHRLQVERARYEADMAKRRYMRVDPENRLVADALEADWNQKLRDLTAAQEEYERKRQSDSLVLNEKQRSEIVSLATDFPRLWRDPNTPDRERKRMVRLMLEDVTLTKNDQITAHVRFKGGATKTLILKAPQQVWVLRKTDSQIVQEIDQLLNHHTEGEIVAILNEHDLRSGGGKPFKPHIVGRIRRAYGLGSRFERLRETGMLTVQEMSKKLGVTAPTVRLWRSQGFLNAYPCNDKGVYLYDPGNVAPRERERYINHSNDSRK